MERDSQRKRVYTAEVVWSVGEPWYRASRAVAKSSGLAWPLPDFRTRDDTQRWIDSVLVDPLIRAAFPDLVEVGVRDGAGSRRGAAHGIWTTRDERTILVGWIRAPRKTRFRAYLLHELAHVVSTDQHGPEWAAAFLVLVEIVFGTESRVRLAAQYRSQRIGGRRAPVRVDGERYALLLSRAQAAA